MKALRCIAVLLPLAILALSPPMAHAIATLEISDGVTTLTVPDNGPGDMNAAVGVVTIIGFPGLTANVDTGISKPVMPFPGAIDLNAILVTDGPKDIILKFSDTDFLEPSGLQKLTMKLGGTLTAPPGSVIAFLGDEDNTNTLFGSGGPEVGPVVFGPGAFSSTTSAFVTVTPPFSLTETVTIHFTGGGTVSFNTELRLVPEPSTLILVGIGLLGLGARAWRQRKQEVRK